MPLSPLHLCFPFSLLSTSRPCFLLLHSSHFSLVYTRPIPFTCFPLCCFFPWLLPFFYYLLFSLFCLSPLTRLLFYSWHLLLLNFLFFNQFFFPPFSVCFPSFIIYSLSSFIKSLVFFSRFFLPPLLISSFISSVSFQLSSFHHSLPTTLYAGCNWRTR